MQENICDERNMVEENVAGIIKSLPPDVTLIAATKSVPAEMINRAIDCGIRHIGENRVQELLAKYEQINKDGVTVHFIGKLQSNKVKYIVGKADLIHSVDSVRLGEIIDKCAEKLGKVQDILLEVNIGGEENKSGVSQKDTEQTVRELAKLPNIRLLGLMAIPPPSCSEEIYFKMRKLFVDIRGKNVDNIDMKYLSLGMSHDYPLAIAHGANMVRVGRKIFGKR